MLSNILIALLVTAVGVVFYWQRDRSSALASIKKYWLLHIVVFAFTAFFTGGLLDSEFGRRIFQIAAGCTIIYFWSVLSGLFQKK